MKRFMIPLGVGAVMGLVLIAADIALGLPFGAMLAVIAVAALAWPRLCIRYVSPWLTRRQLDKRGDPGWRPPGTVVPTTSPLLERMSERVRDDDWDGLRALLADDFAMVDLAGRRLGTALYIRVLKASNRMWREFHSEDEALLADPARPEILYMRSRQTGQPHSGPPLAMLCWMRITLAPGGERVREISTSAVSRAV